MEYFCQEIAKMIDHSLLRPELTEEEIIQGCAIAKQYHVASVCCRPSDLPLVKQLLDGSDVKASTVIGFPHGSNTTATKVFETEDAIRNGAEELDMVLHIGKLRSRDFEYVKRDIQAVVEAAHAHHVLVKVILENAYLTDELKTIGCQLAEQAGADFVKTSTGFAPGGATIDDLKLMRQAVSSRMQIKAAGGVRDFDMALKVKDVGCTRFGATQTAAILDECARRQK